MIIGLIDIIVIMGMKNGVINDYIVINFYILIIFRILFVEICGKLQKWKKWKNWKKIENE